MFHRQILEHTTTCSHADERKKLYKKHPELEKNSKNKILEDFTKKFISRNQNSPIIPIVFHVVHDNGSENISDEQIKDAVVQLNEDFTENSQISSIVEDFQSIVANVGINFKLAEKDPNGNVTTGINRIQSELTYDGSQLALKELIRWDRSMYLNVWVVYSSNGSNGSAFAYYPGDVDGTYEIYDGIVSSHWAIGRTGTAIWTHYKTLTHEVGHWANLKHTWGDQSDNQELIGCDFDDGVEDTPNTIGNTGCNLTAISCNSLDNIQNYMDYSNCTNMFTTGQKNRMLACLNSSISDRNNIWSTNNLNAVFFNNDEPRILYEPNTFYESASNDGFLDDSITITLINVEFSNTIIDTELDSNSVTFENIPNGLSMKVTVIDTTHASLSISGTSNNHNESDSVSNIEVHFNISAFTESDVYNLSKTNIGLNFIPPYQIIFIDIIPDVHNFMEGQSWKWFTMISGIADFGLFHIKENQGSKIKLETYNNQVICNKNERNIKPLEYNTIIGENSDNFQVNNESYPNQFDFAMKDWCDSTAFVGVSFQKNGATHYGWIRIHISENCLNYYALDMAYNNMPETSIKAGQVNLSEKKGTLAYSNLIFYESDNGIISSKRNIDLYGSNFIKPSNNIYVYEYYDTNNVPSGLSLRLEYIKPTRIQVSFIGNAITHTSQSVSVELNLFPAIMKDVLEINLSQNLTIEFVEEYNIIYTVPEDITISYENNWKWFTLGIGDADYGLWYNNKILRLETYSKSAICIPIEINENFTDFELKPLQIDTIIGDSMAINNQWEYTTELEQQPIINENWKTAYAGIKFTIRENFHYGWLQIAVVNNTATLVDYAYNLKPETSIRAGQKLTDYGCIDPLALNFVPNATEQYGECIVCSNTEIPLNLMMYDSYGDGWNGYYLKIINSDNIEVESFTLYDNYEGNIEFCLEKGVYTYVLEGGIYLSEISWEIRYLDNIITSSSVNENSFDIQNVQENQTIVLPIGWSIISTYINLEYNNIISFFNPIVTDLIIVKDYLGNVYLPNEGYNNIGNLIIGHAYQCKMSTSRNLVVAGTILEPELNEITLFNGWNLLGYLRVNNANCETIFSKIIDKIIIVKDYKGDIYLPSFNGYNSIGNLQAGKGYQIKVSEECIIVY